MLEFLKKEYKLTRAFKYCFCDPNGKLTKNGKLVLAFLRDECGAKGELGKNGSPYFYDELGRFDASAALFLQGKRRVFDVIQKHLALDETDILQLIAAEQIKDDNLMDNLSI